MTTLFRLFCSAGLFCSLVAAAVSPAQSTAPRHSAGQHATATGMATDTPAIDGHAHAPSPGFSPLKAGPGLPPSMSEEAAFRFGARQIAREAYAATRIKDVKRQPTPVPLRFEGPLVAVRSAAHDHLITATGTVEINEDTLFDSVVTQSGLVQTLYVFPGEFLSRGQPVISIFSPERINAQHMFLADFSKDTGNQIALQYYSSFSSTKQYLDQSRSNLRWWGFTNDEMDRLLKSGRVETDYVVASPRAGYILETPKTSGTVVVAGGRDEENFVLPGDTILHAVDLRSVWGMFFVGTNDYRYFSVGQPAEVLVGDGQTKQRVPAVVVHKHQYASAQTRRADFHVIMNNVDGTIRPGSFISLEMKTRVTGLWVPETAVLHLRGGASVIRRTREGFSLQPVTSDVSADGDVHIVKGLHEGDVIVANPRSEVDPDARSVWLAGWN